VTYLTIPSQGTATVTLTAGQKITVQTQGEAQVFQQVGFPNFPTQFDPLQTVINTTYTSAAFASGATIVVNAGGLPAFYEVGTDPVVGNNGNWQPQGAPVNIADGGSMVATAAALLSSIVTATPTTGRNIQLPSVTDLNAATTLAVGDSFDWSLITLAAFALTITLNGSHTIVGAAATAATAGASARFRTRKDSATSFISYRIS
jgi:hypothetical protein